MPLPPPPTEHDPLLEITDLHHAYDDDTAIGPINLHLHPGEVVALTGPNGSGKTTALHAAAGLLEPTHGHVRLQGKDPTTLDAHERATRIGIAFQHPAWHITQDTLRQEIQLTPRQLGRPIDPAPWLYRVGLDAYEDTHPWDLSGGERQRMALLTAIAHQPPIVLLDEPTRGLDGTNRARIQHLLAERARRGKATLIASHHDWIADLAHRTVDLAPAMKKTSAHDPREVVYA